MEEQKNKPEERKEGSNNNPLPNTLLGTQPNVLNDALTAFWNFINQPIIANTGLGALMYWALDPKGLKETLESVKKDQESTKGMIKDLKEEIMGLRKLLVWQNPELSGEEGNEDDNSSTNHKRKKQIGRHESAYLD